MENIPIKPNDKKNKYNFKITSGHNMPLMNIEIKSIIKNESLFCKPCQEHKSENIIYCFSCKKGICNYCRINHQDHILTVKNNFLFKQEIEEELFSKIDSQIKNTFELSNPNKLFDFFYEKLDKHFKNMHECLEKYRVQRLKELHLIFETIEKKSLDFNKKYISTKQSFSKLIKEGSKIFPLNYKSEVVFLQIFNLINDGYKNEKNITEFLRTTKQNTINYEQDLTKAIESIEVVFQESLTNSNFQDHFKTGADLNPFERFSDLIDDTNIFLEKFSTLLSKRKKISRNNNANLGNSMNLDLSSTGNKTYHNFGNKLTNNLIKTTILSSSKKKIDSANKISSTKNLSDLKNVSEGSNNKFSNMTRQEDINLLDKFTNLKIYESALVYYLETGDNKFSKLNIKEPTNIEKIMEVTGLRVMNTNNSIPKNMNVYLSPQNKVNPSFSMSDQMFNLLKVYADIDYTKKKIGKENFENLINDFNLNEANSPMSFIEEEGLEYFEVISGTKNLQLYDFQQKKPYIIEIYSLNEKDHSYSIFPYGARCFFNNDKILIFGGKDWNTEYKTILEYDIKANKLIKVGDMINSRSYHSIINLREKNLIFIIGGEKNCSSEMFHYTEFISMKLPCLNYPRASSTLFIQKNNYLWAFCGFRNSIIDKSIVGSFEKLDISEIIDNTPFTSLWEKVNIINNCNVELHFEYVGIMPITDSHAFIYGGYDQRSYKRSLIMIDFINNKLFSIKDKEFADLKLKLLDDEKFDKYMSLVNL